ncbi:hypothetical protein ACJX0J_011622, partial [Zea mays]
MGVAYETAKSGVGVASMGVMRLKLVMKSIVLVVMARVLGIYDLIIAAIISAGLAGLAVGMAIRIIRDTRVRFKLLEDHAFLLDFIFSCPCGAFVMTLRDHSIPSNGDINERAKAKSPIYLLSGLRRRSTAHAKFGPSHHERKESIGAPIKLDVEAHAHIQKHSLHHVAKFLKRTKSLLWFSLYLNDISDKVIIPFT